MILRFGVERDYANGGWKPWVESVDTHALRYEGRSHKTKAAALSTAEAIAGDLAFVLTEYHNDVQVPQVEDRMC